MVTKISLTGSTEAEKQSSAEALGYAFDIANDGILIYQRQQKAMFTVGDCAEQRSNLEQIATQMYEGQIQEFRFIPKLKGLIFAIGVGSTKDAAIKSVMHAINL